MVRTKVDKTEFQLQARTVLAPATSGFDPKATVFTGFAMKAKDTDIVEVSDFNRLMPQSKISHLAALPDLISRNVIFRLCSGNR